MKEKIIVFIDGGAKNNPGPSACGVYIKNFNKKISKYLGKSSNNLAEYQSAILALEELKKILGKKKAKNTSLEIRTDSELLFKQITHQYKIKDKKIIPLFIKLWNLCLDFKKVNFKKIPRKENKIADNLVQQVLKNA